MLVENPSNSLEWMIFLAQKYASMFIKGTWLTLEIAVIGTLVGFVLGYIVGLVNDAKISEGDNVFKKLLMRLLKIIFTVYVEIFRDTPMIVQAMIVYYGIKMLGVEMTPVFAGIVVTVLNTGAYMGETVRAESAPLIWASVKAHGQWECRHLRQCCMWYCHRHLKILSRRWQIHS